MTLWVSGECEDWGGGAPSWLRLETSLQHSPQPHHLLLLSSGITLNVVFHFIPEVFLWRDQGEKEEGGVH